MRTALRLAVAIALAAVVLPTTASAADGSGEAGAALPAANDVVVRYLEHWNSGDVDGLEAVVADDFQRIGTADAAASREDLARLILQTHATYSRVELRVEDSFAGSEGGGFRGAFYGVHREVGRVVEFAIAGLFRFADDGKIREEYVLGDNFLALLGLGYQMTPRDFEVRMPADASGATGDPE